LTQEPATVVELVRLDQQHISAWDGGMTTEIAIYPKDAVYSRRDFLWRISSAQVESEESRFTSLPGIWRLIMVLEGELTLEHEDYHSVRLQAFQQDAFAGGWVTRSRGRGRDFNIMLSEGCTGRLQADELQPGSSWTAPPGLSDAGDDARRTVCIVCAVDGPVSACVGDAASYALMAGDALLVTADRGRALPHVTVQNSRDRTVHSVTATIHYEDRPAQPQTILSMSIDSTEQRRY
jgi:environmental stress-induced protein Ves